VTRLPGDPDGRLRRRERIRALQAQGVRLSSDATEETLKTRIRLAMADLDDAMKCLNQADLDREPNVLDIIDHTIDRATRNMARVATALDGLGSDGTS
jgi:hypothetical protein